MKIIEYFVQGKKKDPEICEDGLFIGDHMIVIIDGVTSKSSYLWNGKKGGCYAKDIILEFLNKDVAGYSATDFFFNVDRFLREKIGENMVNLTLADYPRASIIIYNDYYKEIWSYGDCQCRINDRIYTHEKKIDRMNSEVRAYYLQYACLKGMNMNELKRNDPGRKQIEKNLLIQFEFENRRGDFGYPVLNGRGIEKSLIKKYSVRTDDEIILASDGYPVLERSLEESEQTLNDILEQDPLCFKLYKSTKGVQPGDISFDDRTFCRFVI